MRLSFKIEDAGEASFVLGIIDSLHEKALEEFGLCKKSEDVDVKEDAEFWNSRVVKYKEIGDMLEKYIEIEDNKIWVFVKNPPVALSSLPEAKISRKPLDYPVLPCSNCGSTNTVGIGYRKTKGGQVPKRECLACGKVYTNKVGAAFNMRFPKEIIEYAIKSVGEGITVRKVADLIFQNYHVKVTGASVSNWSNRGRLPKRSDKENR